MSRKCHPLGEPPDPVCAVAHAPHLSYVLHGTFFTSPLLKVAGRDTAMACLCLPENIPTCLDASDHQHSTCLGPTVLQPYGHFDPVQPHSNQSPENACVTGKVYL